MSDIPQGIQLTPFDADFARDPYAVYARLREASPVHWDGNACTVSGYAEVARLLKDSRLSVEPGKLGLPGDPRADNPVTRRPPDLMSLDDPEHARLRRLVNGAFTPGSIAALRPHIESIARTLVAGLPEEFDAVSGFAKPLTIQVIATYLGIDASHHRDIQVWTDTLLMQGYPMPTPAQWDAIVGADAALRRCVRDTVTERKHDPRDDLVSRLIAAAGSDDEVADLCSLLVGAGYFTTADLIGNALLRFTQADRQRLPEFVEETLRLDPPSQSVRRWALEEIAIGGHTIPAGCPVILLIGAANHDPEAGPHLSFGRGIHHCLGAALARLETEVALSALPTIEVLSFKRRKSLFFRGCSEVHVVRR